MLITLLLALAGIIVMVVCAYYLIKLFHTPSNNGLLRHDETYHAIVTYGQNGKMRR